MHGECYFKKKKSVLIKYYGKEGLRYKNFLENLKPDVMRHFCSLQKEAQVRQVRRQANPLPELLQQHSLPPDLEAGLCQGCGRRTTAVHARAGSGAFRRFMKVYHEPIWRKTSAFEDMEKSCNGRTVGKEKERPLQVQRLYPEVEASK